jgi:hypothetical protein
MCATRSTASGSFEGNGVIGPHARDKSTGCTDTVKVMMEYNRNGIGNACSGFWELPRLLWPTESGHPPPPNITQPGSITKLREWYSQRWPEEAVYRPSAPPKPKKPMLDRLCKDAREALEHVGTYPSPGCPLFADSAGRLAFERRVPWSEASGNDAAAKAFLKFAVNVHVFTKG